METIEKLTMKDLLRFAVNELELICIAGKTGEAVTVTPWTLLKIETIKKLMKELEEGK